MEKREIVKLVKYMTIVSIGLFLPFIIMKYVLVYPDMGYDTYHLYLPLFELMVNKITSGNFALMDFTYGLGTNILSQTTSLGIDPFSIIPILTGVVFGVKNTAYGLVYMQIIKTIVAGSLCYVYLSEFNYSKKSKFIAAYIYGFSGYMYGAGQHYAFATIPIILMCVLIGIEKVLKNRKNFMCLILSIFAMGAISPYFSFSILIFCMFYIVIRIYIINENVNLKVIIKEGFPFLVYVIIGLMISAVFFLPVVYIILNVSSRVSHSTSFIQQIISSIKFVSFADFKMIILKLFSENLQGTVNNWNGSQYHFGSTHYFYSILLVLCIPQYIITYVYKARTKKERWINVIIIALVLFFMFSTFLGYLFNLFSAYYYRHTFLVLPLFAGLIAKTVDNIFIKGELNHCANIITICLGILIISGFYDRSTGIFSYVVMSNAIVSLISIGVLFEYITIKKCNKITLNITGLILIICVSLNVFVDNSVILYAGRGVVDKNELKYEYHDDRFTDICENINYLEKDNFFRTEKDFNEFTPVWLNSCIYKYKSVSTYNSGLNKNSIEFVNKFRCDKSATPDNILQAYAAGSYGEMFDVIMSDNLGIKYIISPYERENKHWEKMNKFDKFYVYKNTNINSIGLLYDKYMLATEFDKLSEDQKKLFMAEGVVLNDKQENLNHFDMVDSNEYKLNLKELGINGVYISKMGENSIEGSAYDQGYIDIPIDTFLINNNETQSILDFTLNTSNNYDMKIIFDVGEGFNYSQGLDFTRNINNNNDNKVVYKIPLNAKKVRIIFGQGEFNIKSIGIKQKKIVYSNNGISLETKNNDSIYGVINTDKNQLLYLPIPYEEGWNAYVNDKKVEILQANYGFSAIMLSTGSNKLVMKYKMPWLNIGCIISVFGIMLFATLLIYRKKKVIS